MKNIINNGADMVARFIELMNNKKELKAFVNACHDINCKDLLGRTMLHYAVLNGNFYAVKLLLESDADINAVDNDLRTPIHYLAITGNTEIVEFILKDSDVSHKNDLYGSTPSCLAKWRGNNKILNIFNEKLMTNSSNVAS